MAVRELFDVEPGCIYISKTGKKLKCLGFKTTISVLLEDMETKTNITLPLEYIEKYDLKTEEENGRINIT